MTSSFWKFRPSALSSATNAYVSASSRAVLEDHYEKDNQRAIREGVRILPKQSELQGTSSFRTLHWNINNGCFTGKHHVRSRNDIRAGIVDAIRSADSDVIVLNEYPDEKIFEKELKAIGYSSLDCAETIDYCPTVIATRLPVRERKEIQLSEERSALLIRLHVNVDDDDAFVWVIGTHLDFADGRQRQKEIKILLKELEEMGILGDDSTSRERVVLVGDLNQQRSQDYDPEEWERIRSGMVYRNSCQNDGVSELLMDQGFVCAWNNGNGNTGSKKHDYAERGTSTITNWETSHPPATHWSGTVVDYSYGRNISAASVSISPQGWSDHRMTVCDWTCS